MTEYTNIICQPYNTSLPQCHHPNAVIPLFLLTPMSDMQNDREYLRKKIFISNQPDAHSCPAGWGPKL